MRDLTLLALAVVTAISGLGVLYFATSWYSVPSISISELNDNYIGQTFQVSGYVIDWKEYDNSVSITIKNESELEVFARKDLILGGLELGRVLLVAGEIEEYNGVLEIIPAQEGDIVFGPILVREVRAGELDNYLGDVVKVSGSIDSVREVSSGILVNLNDSTGQIIIPIFFPIELRSEHISVTGVVENYKGQLEIVPKTQDDIQS